MRPLVSAKLSQAFDLSSFLERDDRFPRQILPLEVFRIVMEAALAKLRLSDEGVVLKMSKTSHDIGTLKV